VKQTLSCKQWATILRQFGIRNFECNFIFSNQVFFNF
jgi:hypothetical protein